MMRTHWNAFKSGFLDGVTFGPVIRFALRLGLLAEVYAQYRKHHTRRYALKRAYDIAFRGASF